MDLNQLAFQYFDGVDLMAIEGVSHSMVMTLMSEVGAGGFNKFESSKQLTSWLHLYPNTKITGGKVINSHIPKGGEQIEDCAAQCCQCNWQFKRYPPLRFF